MDSPEVFRFQSTARRTSVLITLMAIWVGLLYLFIGLNAKWWIVVPLFLVTVPALLDYLKSKSSSLSVDNDQIKWTSGSGAEEVIWLNSIELIGIRIRLDFSKRVKIYQKNKKVVRIPPDCTPPGGALEVAFAERNLKVRREFFG